MQSTQFEECFFYSYNLSMDKMIDFVPKKN